MNEHHIEALDREIDARAGDGLVGMLAQLSPVDWAERAAGDRVRTRLLAGIDAELLAGQSPNGSVRGRDGRYRPPPAQNRASGIPARGSHLGCVTAKRICGHG